MAAPAPFLRHPHICWRLPAGGCGIVRQVDDADQPLPRSRRDRAVPRRIHQTYPSHDLPPELRANVERLQAINPGYRHTLYDDAEAAAFIRAHFSARIVAAYDRIDPRYGAARADLFRYLLIYRLGGIYLDIKSTVREPLDQVIRPDDRFLLSHWRYRDWGTNDECAHVPGGEYQQWFIVAAPGHPFLRAVILEVLRRIDAYRPWTHGVGRLATLRTTGPRAYTNAIFPLTGVHPHREVASEEAIGLVYSIYDDHLRHRTLWTSYYRTNTAPLVRLGRRHAFAWAVRRAARRLLPRRCG